MANSSSTIQPQLSRSSDPIEWTNMLFLSITALIALVATPIYIYFMGSSPALIGVFVFYFAATGFSITAGYHRLFAHRSYDAHPSIKFFYLLFGAAACQNSALKWAADHRYHHRFVDQDADPYNIRRGFFHAHIGWTFIKRPENSCFDSVSDLFQDPLVRWQRRFYIPLAILVGGALPLLVGYFLGDALGCFLLSGVTRTVIVHHSTFLINSLCHFVGKQPYSLNDSSRDSALVAIPTLGEGYHNFHHRFQYDYRNGIRWYHFDPTKWIIKTLETLHLVRNLRKASDVHIFKARLGVQREKTQEKLAHFSQEFRSAMENKIHAAHSALVVAYANWGKLKAEYRSARESLHKRKRLILKQDLHKARSHFAATQASWAHLVQGLGLAPAKGFSTSPYILANGGASTRMDRKPAAQIKGRVGALR
ncbi:MAG: acyl-CoA desaturase [Candidatus Binatia bacterium]